MAEGIEGEGREEVKDVPPVLGDPEGPARIAARRAGADRNVPPDENPRPGDAGSGGDDDENPGAQVLAQVLEGLRVMGKGQRLEKSLEDLSRRISALGSTRTVGRPVLRLGTYFLVSLFSAFIVGAVLYAAFDLRILTLEEGVDDLGSVNRGFSDDLRDSVERGRAEWDVERDGFQGRIARLEELRETERSTAFERRAALERRVGELEAELEGSAEIRGSLVQQVEDLKRALATERMRRREGVATSDKAVEKPVNPGSGEGTSTSEGNGKAGDAGPKKERTVQQRLNLLLARQDGARLYRVVSSTGAAHGWLENPQIKVFSEEGEIMEEVKATRARVEISRSTGRVALVFRDAIRHLNRPGGVEKVDMPDFQVDFFDVDVERWGRELSEVVAWRD